MHLPHDPLLLFSICLGALDPNTGGPEVELPQKCHQPRLIVVYSDYAGTLRDGSRCVFFWCFVSDVAERLPTDGGEGLAI